MEIISTFIWVHAVFPFNIILISLMLKMFPIARGKLIDNLGNEYRIETINGMGYARNNDDWTTLQPGKSETATIEFNGNSISNSGFGSTFNLYLEIWLGYRDNSGQQKSGAYSINLQGIK